jgi:energy-coupling factor transporter ATP-binding protein EcfA2
MIHIEHATYSYPASSQPALRDINLDIAAGSFIAVAGANGAGKSTLCALLAGFVPHHFRGTLEGHVVVDGIETAKSNLSELVGHIGLVFQNPYNQLSGARLSVASEVAFGLENTGVPRKIMLPRVQSALEKVGLAALAERSPYSLSGGEMQRLALAAVLVVEPRVLVLDEPTAQLDPLGARQMFEVIRVLAADRGMTVVMAEHRAEWIASFADRLVVLAEGAIVRDGPPREILADAHLAELGLTVPRYTFAARAASSMGRWSAHTPLPVTLDEARQGFAAAMIGSTG